MTQAATALAVEAPSRVTRGLSTLALLSVAHFFIDLYASALSALQPLLVTTHGLSLADAGKLGGALVFSSSLMQPAYGYLSDRLNSRLLIVLAPAVAGLFISALGSAPSFGWLLALVLLGGIGIAAFHPPASATATVGISANRGRWMAVFISAGTLGLAIGPTFFSLLLERVGLAGCRWGAVPGVVVTVVLWFLLPAAPRAHTVKPFAWQPFLAVWKPLTLHYSLVVIRSIVQTTFTALLPLYLTRERGMGLTQASHALSLYLAFGACGGFMGGYLADRLGGRRVVMLSMVGCVPFLAIFFLTTGALSLAGLALGGLILLFTIPVNVLMAQELLPGQGGTVSALMMGFAWGMAGLIFIPLTGWAAEFSSLHAALFSLLAFPLLGFALTFRLPR